MAFIKQKKMKRAFVRSIGAPNAQTQIASAGLVAFIALIMLLSFLSKDFSSFLKNTTHALVTPILSTVSQPLYALSDSVDTMTDLTSLRAENEKLLAENNRLKEWYNVAQNLTRENEKLKTAVNYKGEINYEIVTTQVIGGSSNDFVKSFIIPVGADHGIKEGQAVTYKNNLIGRVIKVYNQTAYIILVTDINARVPVVLDGVEAKAIMAGNNTDAPELTHVVMKEGEILDGAKVLTSGHGGLLPPGLEIGKVVRPNADENVYHVVLNTNPDLATMVQVLQYRAIR